MAELQGVDEWLLERKTGVKNDDIFWPEELGWSYHEVRWLKIKAYHLDSECFLPIVVF